MTYLSLFLFLSALVAVIYKEAVKDNNTIKEHRKVNHVKVWLARAGIMVYVSFLAWSIIAHGNDFDLMPLLGFLLMSAGGFSAGFRWKLNRLRGKDWRYIAPWSNWYDRVWYAVATLEWEEADWLWMVSDVYHSSPSGNTARRIHRAGTIAYIAETIAFAGGLYLVLNP